MTEQLNKRKLEQLIQSNPGKLDQFLRAAAEAMLGDIVVSFGESPSAPGDPPGVDTGALRASMAVSKGDRPLTYYIHDGVEYGIHLEYGTERISPRPFINPVFEDWRARELARFAREFGLLT